MVIINRSDKSKSKSALVEAVTRVNSLNMTGRLNYNMYGTKDGVGFSAVTDKFIDNFILKVLVADYNTKDGKNVFVGSQNKTIRDLLKSQGLEKCVVKGVNFAKINDPAAELLDAMPNKNRLVECTCLAQICKIF